MSLESSKNIQFRLMNAVRLVAAEHYESGGQCITCCDEDSNPADWPCPTARAIAPVAEHVVTALGGEHG